MELLTDRGERPEDPQPANIRGVTGVLLINTPLKRGVNESGRPLRKFVNQRSIFSWLILFQTSLFVLHAPGQAAKEYDRRAACLYKLVDFVDWPPQAFPDAQSPFVIGVLGADPFGKTLDEMVQNEVVKNRKVVVQRYASVADIKSCHILFISQSEDKRLEEVLLALKGKNILTVGDTENFAVRGGVLRFRTERNTLRLRINLEAAKAASLTMSSKLLHIADLVGATGDGR